MYGIYIHIPFCRQKCHYCDFHFSVSTRNKESLLEALLKEIALRKSEVTDIVTSVYLGGGTPSLLTENELLKIFESIHKNFKLSQSPEITLEANPDDLSREYLKMLRSININRLSIGIQSFHDDELQLMNRAHTSEGAKKSVLIEYLWL